MTAFFKKMYSVSKNTNFKDVPKEPGVYRLIWVADGAEKPESINRVLNIDKEGVLYIGQSSNLSARFKSMVKSFSTNQKGHVAARRYNSIEKLTKKIPKNEIWFQYEQYEVNTIKAEEKELLKKYVNTFGEAPPLNSTTGLIKAF